jgi:hypothetical protein
VKCNYFIQKVIDLQAYGFIGKIRIRLEAGGASVAVKRRAMYRSTKVRTLLYYS